MSVGVDDLLLVLSDCSWVVLELLDCSWIVLVLLVVLLGTLNPSRTFWIRIGVVACVVGLVVAELGIHGFVHLIYFC